MSNHFRKFASIVLLSVLGLAAVQGAERAFDFTQEKLGETPAGFRSTVTGQGQPGEWKIIMDEVPSQVQPVTGNAPIPKKQVLAQLSQDPTDEHVPMLIFEDESYGDFTFTTRFKTVSGKTERMAGIAFRIRDEQNYYYVRASSLGNTFRFFKMVNGLRSAPLGPEIQIPSGVWHELTVECKGSELHFLLNGKEVMPKLTDTSFTSGKIGFWTKSDSISYFSDARIVYTPRESLAKVLIRDMKQRYPRLNGLRFYMIPPGQTEPKVVASQNEAEVGNKGTEVELDVIKNDKIYYGKNGPNALVTMPLHDRNGEIVGAVRVELKRFPGQTEKNAMGRALPIVKDMENRIITVKDLL